MQRNLTGYFGKLPDRADFVTGRCPDGFLKLWEPFLMRGLAQSRQELGSGWEDAYMTMPVWHFVMRPSAGTDEPAASAAGALMPSIDKVGRKFPLTIVAPLADGQMADQPASDWSDAVEAVLVDALREDATLAGFQAAVAGLTEPILDAEMGKTPVGEDMAPDQETQGRIASRFWCRAGTKTYLFDCDGLPAPEEFRWLLLPEAFEAHADNTELAGQHHGRYQEEDHRT
ncbi:MAG: type VI secretion system-associated protein TagF [Pseudomonadota bacterium]